MDTYLEQFQDLYRKGVMPHHKTISDEAALPINADERYLSIYISEQWYKFCGKSAFHIAAVYTHGLFFKRQPVKHMLYIF